MAGLPAAFGFARGRETDVLPVVPPENCFWGKWFWSIENGMGFLYNG